MKIKTSEIVFAVICLCAVIVAVAAVVIVRERPAESELTVSFAEPSADEEVYDISVINSATLEDFTQVSGIGQVKAGDIIAFRDAIGGFTRVSQLKDVNGISEALYQRIIEHFYTEKQTESQITTFPEDVTEELTAEPTATASAVASEQPVSTQKVANDTQTKTSAVTATEATEKVMRMVDINSASAEEIADALMIDIGIAEDIVGLRETILEFSAVQELYLCGRMTDELYRRIKDYIIIQ